MASNQEQLDLDALILVAPTRLKKRLGSPSVHLFSIRYGYSTCDRCGKTKERDCEARYHSFPLDTAHIGTEQWMEKEGWEFGYTPEQGGFWWVKKEKKSTNVHHWHSIFAAARTALVEG